LSPSRGLSWLRATFDSPLSSVLTTFDALLLAALDPPFLAPLPLLHVTALALLGALAALALLDPPFLALLPLLHFTALALLGTFAAPLSCRAPLLLSIRLHFTPVATLFCALLAAALLPAFGAVPATLGSVRITAILAPLSTVFASVLTPLGTVLAALAATISPVLASIFAALCASVTAMVAPIIAPIGAASIPGSGTIVVVPIGVDGEGHDRYVGTIAILEQWHVSALPVGIEIVGRDPAAHVAPRHVAP
jgi:hypothetical protein